MDEETSRALGQFAQTQIDLLSAFTVLNAATETNRATIAKVCERLGIDSLDGKSVPTWMQDRFEELVRSHLLTCADEQMAAAIEARMKAMTKRPNQE